MTTIQVPVEEITASAREVRFSRVLVTVLLGIFYVTGWVLGHAWTGGVMAAFAIRDGWRDGAGYPAKAPAQARDGQRQRA